MVNFLSTFPSEITSSFFPTSHCPMSLQLCIILLLHAFTLTPKLFSRQINHSAVIRLLFVISEAFLTKWSCARTRHCSNLKSFGSHHNWRKQRKSMFPFFFAKAEQRAVADHKRDYSHFMKPHPIFQTYDTGSISVFGVFIHHWSLGWSFWLCIIIHYVAMNGLMAYREVSFWSAKEM